MKLNDFLTTGNHPGTAREKSALLDELRNAILSTNQTTMQTNLTDCITILGMSAQRVLEVAENAPKGQLLKTLTDAYIADENAAEAKARPAPAPAKPVINRYRDLSDSLLVKFSLHQATTPVDRAEMQREIAARHITVQPSGSYSKSFI